MRRASRRKAAFFRLLALARSVAEGGKLRWIAGSSRRDTLDSGSDKGALLK